MTPKFANQQAWQQAELLMQPAFIRLIDNIRKQLEQSDWRGKYDNQLLWPDDTPESVKTQVKVLQQQLEAADAPAEVAALEQQLAQLPRPFPIYHLCLQQDDQEQRFDLWELCYQVCFQHYDPQGAESDQVVEVDMSLFDAETGEVDWFELDAKAQRLIADVFATLENR